MKIPKETVDFLEHSLNIDLRLRKFYELFENLHDLEKKYHFPAKGNLEEALFREKLS